MALATSDMSELGAQKMKALAFDILRASNIFKTFTVSFFVRLPNQTWFCAADAPVLFLWDFLLLKIDFESKKSRLH